MDRGGGVGGGGGAHRDVTNDKTSSHSFARVVSEAL